jgi:hypothetical protein
VSGEAIVSSSSPPDRKDTLAKSAGEGVTIWKFEKVATLVAALREALERVE